ncbi:MAG: BBE domain-containing protein [Solirubrobacteraceae bacterium]
MDRFATGAYVNTLSDEGASGVRRAYSDTQLTRLTAVKDAYDPDNVFHLNHNIARSEHRKRSKTVPATSSTPPTSPSTDGRPRQPVTGR